MKKRGKIELENLEEGTKIKIKGNKLEIMTLLSGLADSLMSKSNLSEEDIRFAIDLGINGAKENKAENDKDDGLEEEIPDELIENLLKAILGSK